MAEGGETTNPFDPHGDGDHDGGDVNENIPLLPHEETEMKRRAPFHKYPPWVKTSTSTSGEHETSFIDTTSGEHTFETRKRAIEELDKDIHEVFPSISKKLLPYIRRDDYNRLILNLGKTNSID